jgi:hypothetical protein
MYLSLVLKPENMSFHNWPVKIGSQSLTILAGGPSSLMIFVMNASDTVYTEYGCESGTKFAYFVRR